MAPVDALFGENISFLWLCKCKLEACQIWGSDTFLDRTSFDAVSPLHTLKYFYMCSRRSSFSKNSDFILRSFEACKLVCKNERKSFEAAAKAASLGTFKNIFLVILIWDIAGSLLTIWVSTTREAGKSWEDLCQIFILVAPSWSPCWNTFHYHHILDPSTAHGQADIVLNI